MFVLDRERMFSITKREDIGIGCFAFIIKRNAEDFL